MTPLRVLREPVAPPWHPWGNVATWQAILVLFVLTPLALVVSLLLLIVDGLVGRAKKHA